MARTYHLGPLRRLGNAVTRALLATPMSPPNYVLLTVVGRKTGRAYSIPVRPIEHGGRRYLVAPYGAVSWVRNTRAAGSVTLSRYRRRETVPVVECDPGESAAVLREYARAVPVTRPFFDARHTDPVERFAAEVDRHPVFRLLAASAR